jgi:hypothetical protein
LSLVANAAGCKQLEKQDGKTSLHQGLNCKVTQHNGTNLSTVACGSQASLNLSFRQNARYRVDDEPLGTPERQNCY